MSAATKLAEFNWEDPLLLNEQLTEEEKMIVDCNSLKKYPLGLCA